MEFLGFVKCRNRDRYDSEVLGDNAKLETGIILETGQWLHHPYCKRFWLLSNLNFKRAFATGYSIRPTVQNGVLNAILDCDLLRNKISAKRVARYCWFMHCKKHFPPKWANRHSPWRQAVTYIAEMPRLPPALAPTESYSDRPMRENVGAMVKGPMKRTRKPIGPEKPTKIWRREATMIEP